jgi:lipopolysaccharide export system protein LptA
MRARKSVKITLMRKSLLQPLLYILAASLGWGAGAIAQPVNTALTIRADTQEADSRSGIITATGNVKMSYPARQIDATSAQARYFSKERRIILTGNVIVIQQGNSIKAETITYLIDQGKFEAVPESNKQVESVYIVPDQSLPQSPSAATTPITQIKPAFKSPVSPTASPTPLPK